MTTAQIKLPKKIKKVFSKPRGYYRYRGAFGGRGSGKSFNFAKMAAVFGYAEPLRILCVREFQNSIKESFHAELKNAIFSEPWLANAYSVGIDYIRGINGTEFIFKGMSRNIDSVKSLAQIDICIVEEAENVAESSWIALEPTIRAPNSEIWVIWNPRDKNSPVQKRFIDNSPPRSIFEQVNYTDNPYFPAELEEQRIHNKKTMSDALYSHVWDGKTLEYSDAQIFKDKYIIDEFDVDYSYGLPLYGLDFGFSQDPTASVELYIKENRLYIRRESGKVGLELDDTAKYLSNDMGGITKNKVYADSARPESISYLSRNGLDFIEGVKKWAGSVVDGVAFISSFDEIIIHPECKNTAQEFRLYSYKQNKKTGEILKEIEDKNNHYIDAIRYALNDKITNETQSYEDLL